MARFNLREGVLRGMTKKREGVKTLKKKRNIHVIYNYLYFTGHYYVINYFQYRDYYWVINIHK